MSWGDDRNTNTWTGHYSNGSTTTFNAAGQTNAITTATIHANHQNTNLTHISRNR